MNRERALFITREALESGRTPTMLSSTVTGLLRDYAARGYRILVVTNRLTLGTSRFETRAQMLQAIRLCERHALPVTDVLLVDSSFDPTPFWDAARRFNLSLKASLFVSSEGELGGGARNAGVLRSDSSEHVFGRAA